MKRKRLALLLAIAMTVTSLDSTAMVVTSGADFSSEAVESEEVSAQAEEESQPTVEDEATVETSEGDDFSADVEVTEPDEEVETEPDEEIVQEPEETETADAALDLQDGSDIAVQSAEKEVQSVSFDLNGQRMTFISDIEICNLADAKLVVSYTDGASETLDVGWTNGIKDSYGNAFYYYFVSEDGNRTFAASSPLKAGKYTVQVVNECYNGYSTESKVFNTSYSISVEETPNPDLFPRLYIGETNELSFMTKIRKSQNWFVFTADADEECPTSRYDFLIGDVYSDMEVYSVDDKTKLPKEGDNSGYDKGFAMQQGKSYYVNIKLWDQEVTSINMPVRKLRGLAVPEDDNKITAMQLDGSYTVNIDKGNDEAWFSFTPTETGKYTFASEGVNRFEEGFFFDSKNYYGTATDYRKILQPSVHYRTAFVTDDGYIVRGFKFSSEYLEGGHTYYFCARLSDDTATGSYQVSIKQELSLRKIEVTLNRSKVEEDAGRPLSATLKYMLSDGTEKIRHLYAGYGLIFDDNADPEGNKTQIIIRSSDSSHEYDYANLSNFGDAGQKYEVIFRNGRVDSEPQEVEIVTHEEADCYQGELKVGENPDTVSEEYDYSLYKFVPPATKEYVFSGYNNIEIETKNAIGFWSSVESGAKFEQGKVYYIRLWGKVDDAETCNLKIEEKCKVTELSFVPSRTKAYSNMDLDAQIVGKLTLKYDDGTVWSKDIGFTQEGYTDELKNLIKPVVLNEDGSEVYLGNDFLWPGIYKVHLECGELKSEEYTLIVKSGSEVKIAYSEYTNGVVLKKGLDGLQKSSRLPGSLNIKYGEEEVQITPSLGEDIKDRFGNTIHTDIYDSINNKKYIFTGENETLPGGIYNLCFTYTDEEAGQSFESSRTSLVVRDPNASDFEKSGHVLTIGDQNTSVAFSCLDESTETGWSAPTWYLLRVSADQEGDYRFNISKDNSAYTDEIELQWKKFESTSGSVNDVEIEKTGNNYHLTQGVYLVNIRAPKETAPSTFTISFAQTCMDGHTYGEWRTTKEATCVTAGTKERTCTECGYVETDIIPATGQHVYSKEVEREESTCTTQGYVIWKCATCDDTKKEMFELLEHQWAEPVVVKQATCTEEGTLRYQCKVCQTTKDKPIAKLDHDYKWVTDKEATCGAAGSRHQECTVCEEKGTTETIKATGKHSMRDWRTIRNATAVAAGTQERSCKVCGGAKQFRSIAKLKPTVTLNVSGTLPLKTKQTFQAKAIGLAAGDKVVEWTTSNKKIATVDKRTGKVKATSKTGKATITVKLLSGTKANFTVKVQKSDVATTSITVVNKTTGKKVAKTVNLKAKQKLTLVTTIAPVTSTQKVTYSTSNKKIATVTSKGVITAKKKGTVTITVKSGKKSVKIKVVVK